jgi:hypothetical protein
MSRENTITVEQAVAALTDAARNDFPSVQAQLKAAGFGITGYQPLQGTPDVDASVASEVGTVIAGRGIYHGAWQPRPNGVIVHAYSDTDLLKDRFAKQLLLTWYEARDELARRNGGQRYGDGTEPALRQALAKPSGAKGAYQDGDLVMVPQLLLNGKDVNGKQVRAQNTADLLRGSNVNTFNKISETLRNAGSFYGRWSWSCTEDRDNPNNVRAVRLSDGNDDWNIKDNNRLGVLPFRFFREPHVVKAVGHLTL